MTISKTPKRQALTPAHAAEWAQMAQALALFLKHDKRELVRLADPGIRNWLSASLWARM